MAERKSLDLTSEELSELGFIARSGKAEKRLVQRSQIILCWNEGKSFAQTGKNLV